MKVALTLTCLLLAASPLALAQDNSQTQAPTTTPTPTSTSTGTPTPTSTGSPTPTPTSTSTQTSTPTPTRTRVPPTPGPTVAPPNVQPPVQPPNQPPSPTGTPAPTNSPNSPQTNSVGSSGSVPTSQATVSGSPSDADILYFAYNLEVFEAQFYSCAANGSPIDSSLLGGGPAPTGCQKANLTSNTGTYASELAREETAHVALLQKALQAAGVNPIAPAVDISVTPFNAAAQVATGQQNLNPPFNPYANDWFFLHASFLFEDTGASAYIGALNSISNSSYRLTAAQIAATEVYHAALGRTLLFQNLDYVPAYGLTIRQITDGIVNAVNTLAQAPQIKYALYNNQGAAISNVDSNALTPGASAQQVLRVVTLGAKAGSGGGFFPNNLNGNVKN